MPLIRLMQLVAIVNGSSILKSGQPSFPIQKSITKNRMYREAKKAMDKGFEGA